MNKPTFFFYCKPDANGNIARQDKIDGRWRVGKPRDDCFFRSSGCGFIVGEAALAFPFYISLSSKSLDETGNHSSESTISLWMETYESGPRGHELCPVASEGFSPNFNEEILRSLNLKDCYGLIDALFERGNGLHHSCGFFTGPQSEYIRFVGIRSEPVNEALWLREKDKDGHLAGEKPADVHGFAVVGEDDLYYPDGNAGAIKAGDVIIEISNETACALLNGDQTAILMAKVPDVLIPGWLFDDATKNKNEKRDAEFQEMISKNHAKPHENEAVSSKGQEAKVK